MRYLREVALKFHDLVWQACLKRLWLVHRSLNFLSRRLMANIRMHESLDGQLLMTVSTKLFAQSLSHANSRNVPMSLKKQFQYQRCVMNCTRPVADSLCLASKDIVLRSRQPMTKPRVHLFGPCKEAPEKRGTLAPVPRLIRGEWWNKDIADHFFFMPFRTHKACCCKQVLWCVFTFSLPFWHLSLPKEIIVSDHQTSVSGGCIS